MVHHARAHCSVDHRQICRYARFHLLTCRRALSLMTLRFDRLCWGFWKDAGSSRHENTAPPAHPDHRMPPLPIAVGNVVRRGPGWNPRYGEQDGGEGGTGIVMETKGWASADQADAVRIKWRRTGKENVYRWGFAMQDGSTVYDVVLLAPGDRSSAPS